MQPQTPSVAPATPPQAAVTGKRRVSLNPFGHLIEGTKNFVRTNFMTGLVTMLVTTLAYVVFALLILATLLTQLSDIGPSTSGRSSLIVQIFVPLIVIVILFSLVYGLFGQILERVVLLGTRRQHTTFREAMKFAWKRLPLLITVTLVLLGLIIGASLLMIPLAQVSSALAVLAYIVFVVVAIILAFRFIFIPQVIVDDEKPSDFKAVFKRSSALWSKSGGAVLLYCLMIFVLWFALSAVSGSNSRRNNDLSYTSDYTSLSTTESVNNSPFVYDDLDKSERATFIGAGTLSFVLGTALATLVVTAVMSGLTNIYNKAKEIEDSSATPSS